MPKHSLDKHWVSFFFLSSEVRVLGWHWERWSEDPCSPASGPCCWLLTAERTFCFPISLFDLWLVLTFGSCFLCVTVSLLSGRQWGEAQLSLIRSCYFEGKYARQCWPMLRTCEFLSCMLQLELLVLCVCVCVWPCVRVTYQFFSGFAFPIIIFTGLCLTFKGCSATQN